MTQRADADGVDAKTVERDYVLTHVLAGIGCQAGHERMAFKGGTALRLCFFDDYRYSADLDFSLMEGMTKEAAIELVARAATDVATAVGFEHLQVNGDGTRIEYLGPLGGHRLRSVKLDLADDELVLNTASIDVRQRYEDQASGKICAYTLDEVAAEKLRCVMQRMQARDLFDLNELFVERSVQADEVWSDFEAKAGHKGLAPGDFRSHFEKRVPKWRDSWDNEMETHVPESVRPQFKDVERGVRRALRAHLD